MRSAVKATGNRRSRWPAAGWRVMALGLVTAAGATCTDSNLSLVILQAQRPDDACVISDDTAGNLRHDRGVLDVALDRPYGYTLFPLVANNLFPIAAEGETEPNRVALNGARVKILPPPGVNVAFTPECAAEFDSVGNASIPPGDFRAMSVEVIRSCHASLFQQLFASGRLNSNLAENVTFRVVVRAKGRHGGSQILSDPFEFPIRVCMGCLQTGYGGPFAVFNYPADLPACDKLTSNPYQGNQCPGQIAQDVGPVLCCARNGDKNELQCPAAPGVTMNPAPSPGEP